MKSIDHYALSSISKKAAEDIFIGVFEFELLYTFTLDEKTADQVFGVKMDVEVLVFGMKDLKIEVFIDDSSQNSTYGHLAIKIEDKDALLSRCKRFSVKHFRVDRGERQVLFLEDASGNLFEIK
ncbi:hypothetical protein KAJ26_00435 [bacterium]|nr:hypothetical protein [bacterium]